MRKLLADPAKHGKPKLRPSGHNISANFAIDNGGAIPSNLLQIANTESGSRYLAACKEYGVKAHPARFPAKLPEFFIKLLTKPGDLVVDIFSGSNTTGAVAERLGRRWLACDLDNQYVAASALRFGASEFQYKHIMSGETVDFSFVLEQTNETSSHTKKCT